MGDVIHNLPVVTDLARAFPGIEIDWATEAPYADLVSLHPSVKRVFPIHLRALKNQWWRAARWVRLAGERRALAGWQYDAVIDTQGLVKSAVIARGAGQPISGYNQASAREPLASRFYDFTFDIAVTQHAVERNRQLVAAAMDYEIMSPVDYGLSLQTARPVWLSSQPTVVLLHATSRADKEWPLANWAALGKKLNAHGFSVALPWGNENEKNVSERIAATLPYATVAPAMNLTSAAALLAHAAGVVGVDTGLAHLAVAFKRPTVGIYVATQPALTGLHGSIDAINLGGGTSSKISNPSVEAVFEALMAHVPPPV